MYELTLVVGVVLSVVFTVKHFYDGIRHYRITKDLKGRGMKYRNLALFIILSLLIISLLKYNLILKNK